MSERDYVALHKTRQEAKQLILNGPYRHYKSGEVYYPEKISIDKETEEPFVIYHAENDPMLTFHTSVNNWMEKVEHDGQMVQRYTWCAEEIGQLALRTSTNGTTEAASGPLGHVQA